MSEHVNGECKKQTMNICLMTGISAIYFTKSYYCHKSFSKTHFSGMYMYICIYVYMYICIYVYIYIPIHIDLISPPHVYRILKLGVYR